MALVDGSIELTDTVVEHFDRCLGCMACVTSCPSGVQYDRLIESTRDVHRAATTPRAPRPDAASLIFDVFPYPRRLRAALAFRKLPAPGRSLPFRELAPPWSTRVPPEHCRATGRGRRRDGLRAERRLRQRQCRDRACARGRRFDVHVPRAQGCCGALHAHAGRLDEGSRARELKRHSPATTRSSRTPQAAART